MFRRSRYFRFLVIWFATLISIITHIPVQAQDNQVTATTNVWVTVWQQPSPTSVKLGTLPAGTTLAITGRKISQRATWLRFDFQGQEGWFAGWLATISGNIRKLPVIAFRDVPFSIYTDAGASTNHFVPSGFMGDVGDITADGEWRKSRIAGATAMRFSYTPNGSGPNACAYAPPCKWAGVYWQSSDNNWGNAPTGFDLRGYTKLTFWARSESTIQVEFKVGGIPNDTVNVSTGLKRVTTTWQKFTIPLSNTDLSYLNGGFAWIMSWDGNKITEPGQKSLVLYIDQIRFEY